MMRRAARQSRVQAVGLVAELEALAPAGSNWAEEFEVWHDVEKLHNRVDDRSWLTFAMRHLGHDWVEISEKLGIAISTAQHHFRADFKKAWARLNGILIPPKPHGKGSGQ
jgi:hypothetical protein